MRQKALAAGAKPREFIDARLRRGAFARVALATGKEVS